MQNFENAGQTLLYAGVPVESKATRTLRSVVSRRIDVSLMLSEPLFLTCAEPFQKLSGKQVDFLSKKRSNFRFSKRTCKYAHVLMGRNTVWHKLSF